MNERLDRLIKLEASQAEKYAEWIKEELAKIKRFDHVATSDLQAEDVKQ